ncbi:hypothetical protein Daesc_004783 [Daldinia eschscholtzii]|uniref:High-affinity nicotinic acid transporter n=1 Tax=Daldinia eschscholtzii TaxID=292717 RepID=A0AAX6MQN6_9PEZI
MASNTEISDLDKTIVGHHEYCTDKELQNDPNRSDTLVTTPEATLESFADLDEKKILRKMDLRLIPMLAILYLLSFLDRGNIGNAKIEGLQEDLRMSPDEYNWCLTVFFFTYATFEVPSNLLLKKLRPSRWLPLIMVAILVAVIAFFVLYDFPETASFLTEKEREFIVFRLKYQGQQGKEHTQVAQAEEFEWKYVFEAFKDWQIWVNLFVYWGVVCPLYGISLFLPTIIRNLGYSASTAQLMTVPIYITAAILAVIFAFLSDKVGKRSPFVISFFLMMIVGFSITNPRVVYGGVFVVACAIYPAFPGVVTWLSNNLAGSYKRSAGMAIQIGVGNLGGAMASNFYRQGDSPQYILGHGLELGFISVGVIAAFILVIAYTSINKKRDRIIRDGGENQFTAKELSAKGDKAVTFRYMI